MYYILYDHYENYGIVSKHKTLKEAKKAEREFIDETDGECDTEIIAQMEKGE